MAWTDSRMFLEFIRINSLKDPDATAPTGYGNLQADNLKAALFNNSVTPDRDAAVGDTGYNTGTWLVANEVDDGTNWDAGGEPVTGGAITDQGSGVVQFDATDTPQGGASTTLSDVHGCLVYDDDITGGTVADQGISYHYFGGAQSVTSGTFTVVWHSNGLFRITV
ncbi:hypothetical protein BJP40_06690 [Streptomyces sp. CC53]|uniref:hypothetical protein n=1 Tax=Streptomyces sp. CC53 TaxID=1906740 RepID=UPI0008DE7D27|nr:hypothetical protein [Streptomyces sp. CC53]OII61208.1 hypothetical protein BJP40_06690 [Streptomyces sp. CC53]